MARRSRGSVTRRGPERWARELAAKDPLADPSGLRGPLVSTPGLFALVIFSLLTPSQGLPHPEMPFPRSGMCGGETA